MENSPVDPRLKEATWTVFLGVIPCNSFPAYETSKLQQDGHPNIPPIKVLQISWEMKPARLNRCLCQGAKQINAVSAKKKSRTPRQGFFKREKNIEARALGNSEV